MQTQTDRVYQFIKAEVNAGRGFPTAIMIANHMGWKYPCTTDVFDRLRRQKKIRFADKSKHQLHERYALVDE